MTFGKMGARKMMHRGPVLPPGARWVEYLQGTETQWIDTPFVFNSDTDTVEIQFSLVNEIRFKWCFGSHDTNARCAVGSGNSTNQRNIAYGTDTQRVSDQYFVNKKCKFIANTQGVYLNDNFITGFQSFQAESFIRLFSLNSPNESAALYASQTKMWMFNATRNGTALHKFRPIAIGNMGYMMDILTGDYLQYGNKGTGNFVIGPDIQPPTI